MNPQIFTLPCENREPMASRVMALLLSAFPGKRVKVAIEQERRKRSDPQNNSLFGIAYPPIMEAQGLRGDEEKQELHTVMCGLYFGWTEYEVLGVRKKKPRRTTTRDENGKRAVLTTVEFMEFYDFVCQRAASIGVYVPDPDPELRA